VKTITITLFYLLTLLGFSVQPQSYLIPVMPDKSAKWGYVNLDGEIIIEPDFILATEFNEDGFALVLKNEFKIIDLKGEIIPVDVEKIIPNTLLTYIPVLTDGTGYHLFNNGLLAIKLNNKWGFLNEEGKIEIPPLYDKVTNFNSGYALAEMNEAFYVLDSTGNVIPLEVPGITFIKHFSEGLGMIEVNNNKWGFVNGKGKVVIIPQFNSVGYFNDGLAWARNENKKIGYINHNGEWIITPMYNEGQEYDSLSGLAMVKINNKWGYVDINGKLSFFGETEKTYSFSEGLAIGRKDDKVGFLNNKGQWVFPPQFEIAHPFKNGYAAVNIDGLWGIIDKDGNWILKPAFKQIGNIAKIK